MSKGVTMLSTEDRRDIARRLYDIASLMPEDRITRGYCRECYLDGLWLGLVRCGVTMAEFAELQDELEDLVDGLIEGDWE